MNYLHEEFGWVIVMHNICQWWIWGLQFWDKFLIQKWRSITSCWFRSEGQLRVADSEVGISGECGSKWNHCWVDEINNISLMSRLVSHALSKGVGRIAYIKVKYCDLSCWYEWIVCVMICYPAMFYTTNIFERILITLLFVCGVLYDVVQIYSRGAITDVSWKIASRFFLVLFIVFVFCYLIFSCSDM